MRVKAALVAGLVALIAVGLSAAKPQPEPRCSVQFRDAAGDVIRSDGAGPYVDGVAGVDCHIQEPSGWLTLQFAQATKRAPGSSRKIAYVGQLNGVASLGQLPGTASYTSFTDNSGTFEIKFLETAVAPLDVMPFRARFGNSQFLNGFGQFDGDSGYTGTPPAGTSGVFVTTVDACTWVATSYSTGVSLQTLSHGENATTQTDPRVMVLHENAAPIQPDTVLRGYFSIPFAATIRVIANKPGCPL
jgi:hypothetical protein